MQREEFRVWVLIFLECARHEAYSLRILNGWAITTEHAPCSSLITFLEQFEFLFTRFSTQIFNLEVVQENWRTSLVCWNSQYAL